MTVIINGDTGITNDGGYSGDGIVFADTTPANTLVTTTAGNVGIGTASPPSYAGYTSLALNNATSGGVYDILSNGTRVAAFFSSDATTTLASITSIPLAFRTGNTERMRLDTSGRMLMGCTSTPSTTVGGVLIGNQATAEALISSTGSYTGGSDRCVFINGNGTVGKISVSGSTTTYATSSDYRLKENVSPMANALDRISALKPVTYSWKADGSHGEGFIAHELQEVCPDAVVGEKDAVETVDDVDAEGRVIGTKEVPKYQSIDTSFLVATLTKAIQELNAKVDAQALEIQALKGTA